MYNAGLGAWGGCWARLHNSMDMHIRWINYRIGLMFLFPVLALVFCKHLQYSKWYGFGTQSCLFYVYMQITFPDILQYSCTPWAAGLEKGEGRLQVQYTTSVVALVVGRIGITGHQYIKSSLHFCYHDWCNIRMLGSGKTGKATARLYHLELTRVSDLACPCLWCSTRLYKIPYHDISDRNRRVGWPYWS